MRNLGEKAFMLLVTNSKKLSSCNKTRVPEHAITSLLKATIEILHKDDDEYYNNNAATKQASTLTVAWLPLATKN